ncbi:MAG TPA: thioredoxin domain-containing protein [Pyrinomonadaceae bacterium]|nr:thioredoxin domain-containing protein [Pyrinomonadaceae bacterium]
MNSILLTSLQPIKVLLALLLCPLTLSFAQTADKVVAVVNGREIRQREVDQLLIPQVMALEEQLYAIRRASLENLVLTALLESESVKRGISLEQLRKILTAGKVEVQPAEVENAYAQNASAFGAMSPDEAKERLRLDLETQARLEKYKQAVGELRQAAIVEVLLQEPRWPWLEIAQASPTLGTNDSLVTIVEFADFQCPYCRESQNVLKQVLKSYPHDVRLVFKHLPLDTHSQAFTAARASFCAEREGRFWEFHDAIFALRKLDAEDLRRAALSSQLDLAKFDACLNSDDSRQAVEKHKQAAARWGIDSTPTFFINGKMFRGALDFVAFKKAIEQELTSARTSSVSTRSGCSRC